MISRFKRNFHTFADMLLFIRIFFWINLIVLMLKLLSFSRMLVLLTPKRPTSIQATDRRALISKVPKYTDFILGRNWWIYRMNCLKRALVIFRVLRLYGIDVQICMGVRKDHLSPAVDPDTHLQGHAWLMVDDKLFLEDSRSMTTTYTPVFSFP
ncbi:MAG: lasso peptide biosynthesis B2 protein [Desulfosarcina sp.]|nr:lasso peptide biosynthesis B2 protein [Desulfosarcina sp.]